jgi:hypothetical protein
MAQTYWTTAEELFLRHKCIFNTPVEHNILFQSISLKQPNQDLILLLKI